MTNRYLCLHGHFYQPPRENPWLEAVEVQDSAAPYHDWNERITMECYGPNTAARISTWEGKIIDIRNNFARMSFNFGPTLLQWMENHSPEVYEDIIEADRQSVLDRNGHGNALAQGYNHVIMPLATERERLVQTVWGMEDFRERFGRDPEGMWLPECAVDLKTLECLASNGIKFTVLAPRQARRFRLINDTSDWMSVEGGRIDPTRPYLCTLPSGRSIALFFYDGPISQAIAFEGLLNDGRHFVHRLMQGFSAERTWPQLLSIATDGESYGHHHRHGEMALVCAMHITEAEKLATLTNFGEFLAMHTPDAEVQIWNNSSWSCVHGVDRWRSDCGCNSGMKAGWNQKWRSPVREAFRFLANKADEVFDSRAKTWFPNPEKALLDYIHVILDQGAEGSPKFLDIHAPDIEDTEDQTAALRMMEIMRNAQLMFTSCAWFFDEVSGIETVQNMKYAGRLLQLLRPYAPGIEARFLQIMEKAPSNVPSIINAAECFRRYVKPNVVDLQRVVAHHAMLHYDTTKEGFHRLFCYELHERDGLVTSINGAHLKMCRIVASSLIDREKVEVTAIVLHFGGHDFRCSITGPMGYSTYEALKETVVTTFQKRPLTELIRMVDENFGRQYYTLEHVFSEGRRDLLQRITMDAFGRFDNSIRMIYEENRKFMEYLIEAGAQLPQGFLSAADFVIKTQFIEELDSFLENGDGAGLLRMAKEASHFRIRMSDPLVMRRLEMAMEQIFHDLAINPSVSILRSALALLEIMRVLDIQPDNWEAQNIVFALVNHRPLPAHLTHRRLATPDDDLLTLPEFKELAEQLRVNFDIKTRNATALQEISSRSANPATLGGSSEQVAKFSLREETSSIT